MSSPQIIEEVTLQNNEESAVFLGVNRVDIFKIKGLEFYHSFLIILTRNPLTIPDEFNERTKLFYDLQTRNEEESEVVYFDSFIMHDRPIWATTIGASSECAYDTTATKMGNLIKVPNFDRVDNVRSGERVYVKKLASNDTEAILRLLQFEGAYDNSLEYALVPEINKEAYNSNSFARGALEYAELMNKVEFKSCFRTPGISKPINLSE